MFRDLSDYISCFVVDYLSAAVYQISRAVERALEKALTSDAAEAITKRIVARLVTIIDARVDHALACLDDPSEADDALPEQADGAHPLTPPTDATH